MKYINGVLVSILILIFSQSIHAQRIKLFEKNFKELKGQKSFSVKFTYDSMIVGEATPEDKFLERKKNEWDLKNPYDGPAFIKRWYAPRKDLYEPSFIKFFENSSKLKLLDSTAKYTVILKTKRTEGGWYGGIVSHPGQIDGELWIVESLNEANVQVKIAFYNISGKVSMGGDFEMIERIQSSYEALADFMGSYISRKIK